MKLSVLTPERKVVFDQEVTEVTVPLQSGEVQILPGHVPMIANLGTGILVFKTKASDFHTRFVVSLGYCEVNPTGVNILTEFVQAKDEVNLEKTQKESIEDQKRLGTELLNDADFEILVNKIEKAESAISLANS